MPSTLGIVSSNYVELPPPTFTGTTVLRLSGEGPNGGNNKPIDISSAPKTITSANLATVALSPFAGVGGSAYFNGNGYLEVTGSVFPNTGNYTIEAWIYITSNIEPYQLILGTGGSNNYWGLVRTTGGYYLVSYTPTMGASNDIQQTSGEKILLNTWTHVAWSRQSNILRYFVNGSLVNTDSSTGNITANLAQIGRSPYYNSYFVSGNICDLRIANVALYTSNFARPSAPLTTTSNGGGGGTAPTSNQVSLLLNTQQPSVIDSSGGQPIIHTVDGARISTAQKKNGNSSIYFDGNGDVLKIPHSNNFVFGSKNFMIATWVYNLDTSGSRTIFSKRPTTTVAGGYAGIVLGAGAVYSAYVTFTGSSWEFLTGPTAKLNTWEHVAVIRQGSTFTLYVNGRPVATLSDSRAIVDSTTASVTIGADSDTTTFYANCYLDDFVVMTNP